MRQSGVPNPMIKLNADIRLPFAPWWLLWCMLLASSWLSPNHYWPWLAFDTDALVALWSLVLAIAIVARHRGRWDVPGPAMAAVALCAVPVIQASTGVILFAGDAWMAVLYLCGFALGVIVGARAERLFPAEWVDALFGSLLIAGIASVGMQLYQWLHLSGLYFGISDLPPGSRPFANLAQPNQLATLLGWSLVGTWWFHLQGRIRGSVAVLAAAFLLFGIVMTQSRTAWLFLALLLIVAVAYRRQLSTARYWHGLVLLTLAFVAAVACWSGLNEALNLAAPQALEDRLKPGTRGQHWQMMVEAIGQRPWFGWGWNQVGSAQQAVALQFPPSGELINHSHNIVLDLMVWNGIPLGLAIVVAAAAWLWSTARRFDGQKSILLTAAIGVLLVHAMLEFPHTYAYMLLPAGLMIGTVASLPRERRLWTMPRWGAAIGVLLVFVGFVWTAGEYLVARSNLDQLRFEAAHVGRSTGSQPPELYALTQLGAFLTAERIKLEDEVTPERLELMRKTSERYPAGPAMFRYALASARSGDLDSAQVTLRLLCRLHPPAECDQARSAWEHLGRDRYPALRALPFPDR